MFTNRTFVCFYISRGCLFMGNTIYKNIKEYKKGNKEIFREILRLENAGF